ncbi:MAG: exodeoxyribonuclease VII large subunit [Myxococcota bacterium]
MAQGAQAGPRVYAVGEVVAGVRRLLEDRVGRIWVVGEVRGLSRPRSGHVYFDLVDDAGQLKSALFRADARRLAFDPEEGMEVLAYGDLTVYEQRGDLQLVVRQLEPRGVGALQIALEQLRRRLQVEGLFDADRKQEIPSLPERIGVVTSATGAALRDVLQVTGRRWPTVPILISPTRVQGPGAEQEIVAALRALEKHDVSVVLLVRGGGSLEDLQAFNSEAVARAIDACPIPVVAGVGHEVDATIADQVADLRAPTPSAAAELAVPDRRALRRELARAFAALADAARGRVDEGRARVARAGDALRAHAPDARLRLQRQRLGAASRALLSAARALPARGRGRLGAAAARLEALSPLAVLGRGYGLVRRARDGAIVRGPEDVAPDESLDVELSRARLTARVLTVQKRERG